MNKILKIKEELGNIGYSIRSIIRFGVVSGYSMTLTLDEEQVQASGVAL